MWLINSQWLWLHTVALTVTVATQLDTYVICMVATSHVNATYIGGTYIGDYRQI